MERIKEFFTYFKESVRIGIVRYFLKKYIGFLVEDIDVEELSIDLHKGSGNVKNLNLNTHSLNEVADQLNLPLLFIDGYIGEISVNVPWKNLLHENCFVEITNLNLTLRPKSRLGDISLVDSMIDSMSSSVQIAQECLSQVTEEDFKGTGAKIKHKSKTPRSSDNENTGESETEKIDAVEYFAKAIDTILCKIKIRFNHTVIRIEYLPKTSSTGIALEAEIKKIDYFDEAGFEKVSPHSEFSSGPDKNNINTSSVLDKKFLIEGISIYSDEFPSKKYSSENDIFNDKVSELNNTDKKLETFNSAYVNTNGPSCNNNFNHSLNSKLIPNICNENIRTNGILIAKILYRQEIKLQLRKAETKGLYGPKVNVEINFGCFISYLSPRQVHLLLELLTGISSPEKVENLDLSPEEKCNKQKPMNQNDFRTVERDLIKHASSPTNICHALNDQEGWSSPPDITWDDDLFYPMNTEQNEFKGKLNPLTGSTLTDISDFESSFISTASTNTCNTTASKNDILTNFKIRVNSICIILLHEDILISSESVFEVITQSSLTEMKKRVENFFSLMNCNSNCENSYDEFLYLKNKIQPACLVSHLRCVITGILIEGNEKLFSNKWELNTNISASWLEIKECVNDSDNELPNILYSDILLFTKNSSNECSSHFHVPMKHKLEIDICYCIITSGRESSPKMDITIKLDDCLTEIDFSIIDRIHLLLNVQDITRKENVLPILHLNNYAHFQEMMKDVNSKPETIITVNVKSNLLSIKLFFPIPDLRPSSNINRVPWWKKNVRKEVLILNLEEFLLKSILNKQPVSFEILSSDITILLQETKDISPTQILRASSAKDIEKGFNPVRIYIKSYSVKKTPELQDLPMHKHENVSKSMMGFLSGVDEGSANLFSKRKVACQNQGDITEIPIPSSGDEIYIFINETLKNVQHDIDITLNDVKLILPSKHVYEIIYNRLISDLLLWSPSAPKYPIKIFSNLYTIMDDLSIENTLVSESSNPSSEFNVFSSLKNTCFSKDEFKNNNHQSYNSEYEKQIDQTFIGLQVKIQNAAGSIHTPYRDENGKIIPGKHGNISFLCNKGCIFIASGYQGDSNAFQGCISLNSVSVYHNPNNISLHSSIELNSDFLLSLKNMNPLLQKSEALCKIGGGSAPSYDLKDCVTLCFKSYFDDKRNENLFEVVGHLYNLTLRYYMTNSSENWIAQIQDMFNIEDYPIEGYTLPETVTEMNFNFEFCGIDYRPCHLLLKSYFAIDSLVVSSNLAVKGNTSVIMFIVEDAGLFLSENLKCTEVNLKNNYICVLDVGVFEVCMKFDCLSSDIPFKELNVSNNLIHIRTCSDSCKAFMELLIYFSNCGDLVQDPLKFEQHSCNEVIIEPSHSEEMICSQYDKNVLSKHDIVANMMQEAMIEASLLEVKQVDEANQNKHKASLKVDEFFFPGENKKKHNLSNNIGIEDSLHLDMIKALREAQIEDATAIHQREYQPNNDDEFCVLEDIPGTGIKSPTGKPKVKYIINEPICIKESYFDPTTLKSYSNKKKYFPIPYCKYNLQEMSVVWLMYGGKDFATDNDGNKNDDEKNANRSSTILHKPNANMKWFSVGGSNRCHDILMEINLNKIKFKYEMYSEAAPFVSQHFFAINDIVIRDCLASSNINKFLYQLPESFSKHASSNMIQIKAISRRSDPAFTYESNLNISCQPIRLNIDQDAVIFLYQFIDSILKMDKESEVGQEERPCTKFSHQPVLSLNSEDKSSLPSNHVYVAKYHNESHCDALQNSPIYFRSVIFSPDVPITIDYHGKHIDINSQFGPLAGLIIGLGHLDHSELTLKRIHIKTGVLGIHKLVNCLINEWVSDIKKNQLPSLLTGVGPMHSLVRLFSGIKDLFWLPIEQYHKDGRVIKGLQRGTSAFTSSSAYAVLDLSSRFVGTIQSTAEMMYDMVSSGPSVKNRSYKAKKGQPKDIREGVSTAYGLVRNGLGDTALTLFKVAAEEHSHKGVSGAVGGLLRQIPPSVVQPIIIASEATCTVIGGMTNQLVPDAGKEAAEKWKA